MSEEEKPVPEELSDDVLDAVAGGIQQPGANRPQPSGLTADGKVGDITMALQDFRDK